MRYVLSKVYSQSLQGHHNRSVLQAVCGIASARLQMLSSYLSTVQAWHHAHTRELICFSKSWLHIHPLLTSLYIPILQQNLGHNDPPIVQKLECTIPLKLARSGARILYLTGARHAKLLSNKPMLLLTSLGRQFIAKLMLYTS